MLPKVAGQILHHTSRAVAVIQNQTGSTFRNVLHTSGPPTTLGGRPGSGSNNSGWGGTAEPGGPKAHTGSRFHSSFASSARVVAHADPSSSNVDGVDLSDDYLDLPTPIASRLGARTSHRLRSTTLSQGVQKGDSNVLKALRQHVRTNHAFASVSSTAQPSEPPVPLLKSTDAPSATSSPEQLTSATESEEHAAESDAEHSNGPLAELLASLAKVKTVGNREAVEILVQKIRATGKLNIHGYNHILDALREVRRSGESLASILEVYNEMLARDILPSFRTYSILILAFTDRDSDVHITSTKLERRILQRRAMGITDSQENKADQEQLVQLNSENNMASALKLFQTATSRIRSKASLTWTVYNALLRSCANHGNVDAALEIFAHFERRKDVPLAAQPFAHLINTYAKVGDIQGAEQVFEEFRKASIDGRLSWSIRNTSTEGRERSSQSAQIGVWNCMIETYFVCGRGDKGLALLEEMLDSGSGLDFGPKDIPVPSPTTFSSVIVGFCRAGDLDSALEWFWRLLADGKSTTDNIAPCLALPKPTNHALRSLIMYLVMQGNRIEDINKVWATTSNQDITILSTDIRRIVLMANIQYLESIPAISDAKGLELTEFTFQRVLCRRLLPDWASRELGGISILVQKMVGLYNRFGGPDAVVTFAKKAASEIERKDGNDQAAVEQLGNMLIDAIRSLNASPWTFTHELSLAHIAYSCHIPIDNRALIESFLQAKAENQELPQITPVHSHIILEAALQSAQDAYGVYSYSPAVESIMEYISDKAFQLSVAPIHLRQALNEYIKAVQNRDSEPSPTLTEAQSVQSTQSTAVDPSATPAQISIDSVHSNYVDEYRRINNTLSAVVGYERLLLGAQLGVYPTPQVIGRLINFLGRAGEVEKLKETYHIAQQVLASLPDKNQQSMGWFHVEDSMVIALAHAGDVDAAHIHRTRIIEQGGTPSPDAYGALVQHVTSTTDDAANAMALYQEAISRNVTPNLYLYNTIISKLAKARKADSAIQLFQELKMRGIQPSSVTYGSVIAACCRVGDAQSAETLFEEMASQPSFKPRVPPYNTMMQFYTHTKPDRERVLFYYDALIRARVLPTAHTYKLLLDAYGTIAPQNYDAMQQTFDELVANTRVAMQGTHWAALINAWGCSGRDLTKALEIFNAIESHPRSRRTALPDAVCYEALFNVLVSHNRTDLFPLYTEQLAVRGVHMTAYIANLLIKGYAASGNMDSARALFEGLVDPPQGVAAPNNHASGEQDNAQRVSPYEPVYREPSTWEAMIAAELSHGNQEKASQLLVRAEARCFPEAVMARISGVRHGELL
ncbi:hypothetical protein QCA50_001107 [Cerrena zonata]|uniref:PROP1-like PPR domain-containing protein n=1 Tax=Cerrena zonata TaxID=2478898 RepID=A0AAW0GT73_9APHY